ncbi:MAG: peptide chain release factor N(5)-glutamine methyltransferase [Anaerolineales bacterium]|nr:peptide chain release factor N(5)-glutamine methyltransferase [Anaerolineales bacterium]
MPITIQKVLAEINQRLGPLSETASLDAQVLASEFLSKPRAWLRANPDAEVDELHFSVLQEAIQKIEQGTPLPYILGHWEFYGRDFDITPDVLIPRPETELLVETAIAWLRDNPQQRTAVDVGTGSGCIAVSLAAEVPDLKLAATDISVPALEIACCNAIKHGVDKQISFVHCDLLPGKNRALNADSRFAPGPQLPTSYNLITANLPYIPTEQLPGLEVSKNEPLLALDGGKDGLEFIRALLEMVTEWLSPGGLVLLEIEASQGMQALSLAFDTFSQAKIRLHKDLAKNDRLLEIRLD